MVQSEFEQIQKTLTDLDQRVFQLTKKVDSIRRKMMWASIYGVLKFLVIVIPLVVGYVYLQPELNKLYRSWGQIMNAMDQLDQVQAANGTNQELLNQLHDLQTRYPQLR